MLQLITPLAGNLLLWLWLAAAGSWFVASRGRRRQRLGGFVALGLLWLLASGPVADLAFVPLESQYPLPALDDLAERGVRQVVVLTSGGYPDHGELMSSSLPADSSLRFLGGLELCARLGPDCQVIFSGSAGRSRRDLLAAFAMRDLARQLDPDRPLVAEAESGSTAEHPRNVQPLITGPFALVTSAYHMPRAMRSFRRAGLDPIAFPVAPYRRPASSSWTAWLPSSGNLQKLDVAWREYLANALYLVRGW